MGVPRILYLLLAVAGLVMTWRYNLQLMAECGAGLDPAALLSAFLAATSVNAAVQSLSWDLTIACLAGLVWIIVEARRLAIRHAWLYVVLTVGVAWAFAFPLFLFVRQGKLDALAGTHA